MSAGGDTTTCLRGDATHGGTNQIALAGAHLGSARSGLFTAERAETAEEQEMSNRDKRAGHTVS